VEHPVIDHTISEEWFEDVGRRLQAESGNLRSRSPFPYVVLDDFLPSDLAIRSALAFPTPTSESWIHYSHYNSSKWGLTDISLIPQPIDGVIELLNSERFRSLLSDATGIPDLLADDELSGGGLHMSGTGGYLNVHTDFSAHPSRRSWRRRLNLLLYLNNDWDESWGGHLELWDTGVKQCAERVAPILNRCVIFVTDRNSLHGVPDPLATPDGRYRCSVAMYYFTDEGREVSRQATKYRARPDEKGSRLLVKLDSAVLGGYSRIRDKFGIDDRVVGNALAKLKRLGRKSTK